MKILKKYLGFIFFISILICFSGMHSYAQTVYDWTGATSNDWTVASNWQVGGLTATVYPGQASSTDVADFGVNYGYSTHFQPSLLSGSITIGSLNMGDNKIPAVPSGAPNPTYSIVLTINGALNIGGAFTQMHSTGGTAGTGSSYYGRAISNRLAGTGTMTCGSFTLGDSTVPSASNVVNTTQFKIGGGSTLIITDLGDFTLYSPASKDGSTNIISINDPELSFASGTLNVYGQIKVTNVSTPYIASGFYVPLDFFSMDLFTNADSPVLNLYNANPLSIQTGAVQNSVDFYQVVFTGGTGTATVNFAGMGATQEILIYKGTAGTIYNYIDHTPSVYQNVTFSGAGTKSATLLAAAGTFSVAGNFTLAAGTETVDISANNPILTIGGNYSSASGTTLLKSNASALTIPGTTTNGGTFTHSGGAPITFTGAFTNTATGTYNQTGSSTVTASSTTSNTGTYNQSGTALATFTGAVTNTGTINQTSTGNILFSAAFNNSGSASIFSQTGGGTSTFTGAATNDGKIIQNSTGTLTFPNTFSNTLSGSLFTLTTGTTNFTNSYSNSGTFMQTGGTVNFNQPTTQALTDNSTGGTTFSNVFMKNGGTQTMSGTGQFYVSDLGLLNVTNSTTLNVNNSTSVPASSVLTLLSDANGSATVTPLGTSTTVTGTITGNVNVQRFITGGPDIFGGNSWRGYRLLSSPVYTATSTDGFSNKIYSINYLLNNTFLTGTSFATTATSKSGNPTLYLYRENLIPQFTTFLNSNYRGIGDISAAPNYTIDLDSPPSFYIPIGNGFLFFFRGSQATVNPFTTTTIPLSATVSATGTLNQGTINVVNWFTPGSPNLLWTSNPGDPSQGFNLVGNPYASSIDWDKFSNTDNTAGIYGFDVSNFIYMLHPGGAAGAGNYAIYTGGGIGGTNGGNNVIPSGVGFFVQAGDPTATLTFTESAKVNTQVTGDNLFLSKRIPTTTVKMLRLQLALDSIHSDETIIAFNNQSKSTFIPSEDARYKTGTGKVTLASLSSDNVQIAINQMPLALRGDTIKLQVGATASGTYSLKINALKGIPPIYSIWLKDAFTKDSVNMRTTASYSFAINTADSTTFGSKRFTLLVVQDPNLAYKLVSFDAVKAGANNKQVQLTWKTQNEQNYTNFVVERSNNNGKSFDAIGGTVISSSAGSYSLLDKDPLKGDNLYRLKQEDINSTTTYSNIVEVDFNSNNGLAGWLSCYPNPAFNNIHLSFDPKSPGHTTYNVKVTNSSGMIVRYAVITEPNWQANISNLLIGTYLIQVTDKKDNSVVGQAKFVKL
ncbi:MAG: T9SS type A sorting domain-containing protein [Sphingobacteriales bacterium]